MSAATNQRGISKGGQEKLMFHELYNYILKHNSIAHIYFSRTVSPVYIQAEQHHMFVYAPWEWRLLGVVTHGSGDLWEWRPVTSNIKAFPIVIVISKFLKRYSKAKRTRAPAYS